MSLSAINRKSVIQAIEEFDSLGRSRFLDKYGYGPSQSYFLEFEGQRYDSKAICGVAVKFALGSALRPEDFSGGALTVQTKLESLGFTIVHEEVNSDWSREEVRAIVTDYFDMLKAELSGEPYNKSEHRRELAKRLNDRSKGSIEFKHANVSSALAELGLPYIEGYKPREHSQGAVAEIVDEFIESDMELVELFHRHPENVVAPSSLEEVEPPSRPPIQTKSKRPRRPVRIDYQRRENENRELGLAGEKLVVEHERNRLTEVGRLDLAERVEHVSQTRGDGLGYDVLSFDDENGDELFIEVKTTNRPAEALLSRVSK